MVANGVVFAISTGENTLQRHTDPRYTERYQKPGEPPPPTQGLILLVSPLRANEPHNVALVANGKPNSMELLDALASRLASRIDVREVRRYRKPSVSVPDATRSPRCCCGPILPTRGSMAR